MSSSQEIGKSGQKAFSLLCSDAGLICNESNEDEAGWDFFVQFQLDNSFKGPLDQRPAPLCAFVQVKASHSPITSIEVKLSNAERMVTEPKPSFFAMAERSGPSKAFAFRLGHIGEKAIIFILKALREAAYKQIKSTNRKKIYIPLELLDVSTVETSQDIPRIIRKHSFGSLSDYISNKAQLTKTVGYGSQPFVGSFSVVESTGEDRLISLMIGELEELEVSDFRVRETRFGIELPKIESSTATIRIDALDAGIANVIFESKTLGLQADFKCTVRSPNILELSVEMFRIRLFNDNFSFSINPIKGVSNWIYNPKFDAVKPWSDIKDDLILFLILASGGGTFTCFREGDRFAHGQIETKGFLVADISSFITTVNVMENLSRFPEFRLKARFSLDELFSFADNAKVVALIVAERELDKMVIEVKLQKNVANPAPTAIFIFGMLFKCNNRLMAVPVLVEGNASVNLQKVKLHPTDVRIEECSLFAERPSCIEYLRNFTRHFTENRPDSDLIVVQEEMNPV